MHIQYKNQKNDSRSCMKECCSPNSTPIAINTLVPVFPFAPEAPCRRSWMARSRSMRNEGHEGLFSSSLIIKLFIEMSCWRMPAFNRSDSCPDIHASNAARRETLEL